MIGYEFSRDKALSCFYRSCEHEKSNGWPVNMNLMQTLNGVCDAGDLQSIMHTSSTPMRQEFFGQDTHNFAPGFPGLRHSTTGQLKVDH